MGGGGPFIDAEDIGLCPGLRAAFLKFAIEGWKLGVDAALLIPGLGGAEVGGGRGAAIVGGFGADVRDDDSGSEVYDESRLAVAVRKCFSAQFCLI